MERRGGKGRGPGSNMWSWELSLLSLERPEPCVRWVHPTSARAQCTRADVCTCSHTHTHTGDSPAAPSSSSHKLGQPLPHPRSNRCLGKCSLLSTAPAAASRSPELLEGAPRAGLRCQAQRPWPGSRLDPSPHCSGCLGGLQEASHLFCQSVTMTITPCAHRWCGSPSPFPSPLLRSTGEGRGHLAASANSCWD